MDVIITAKDIEQARIRGACDSGLKAARAEKRLDRLQAEYLRWVHDIGLWRMDACQRMCDGTETDVLDVVPLDLFAAGYGDGDGCGYGDGYGDGDGDGYGSGYGDGYGYGSGDWYGSGYGYGYGDWYGR